VARLTFWEWKFIPKLNNLFNYEVSEKLAVVLMLRRRACKRMCEDWGREKEGVHYIFRKDGSNLAL